MCAPTLGPVTGSELYYDKGETHLQLQAVYEPALHKGDGKVKSEVLKVSCWDCVWHHCQRGCSDSTGVVHNNQIKAYTESSGGRQSLNNSSSFLPYNCAASPPPTGVPRFASCVRVLTCAACFPSLDFPLEACPSYLSGPEGVI